MGDYESQFLKLTLFARRYLNAHECSVKSKIREGPESDVNFWVFVFFPPNWDLNSLQTTAIAMIKTEGDATFIKGETFVYCISKTGYVLLYGWSCHGLLGLGYSALSSFCRM